MAIIRLQGETEIRNGIYYEVDTSNAPIGEGGMGRVYKGVCVDAVTKITRPVAIKFLFDGLSESSIERARREASIHIKNDNIVEMLGFIETQTLVNGKQMPHYHVVSELLHGISLSDILDGKNTDGNGNVIAFAEKLYSDFKTDPTHFAKTIVSNVLSGLVALHDAGYVHRDIDPTNIMITDDEHIKLIDFGIAKQVHKLTTNDRSLTTAGVFMGKAEYAAPELALGDTKHQDQTTDIYAMGILLYQCIVGHTPFEGTVNAVLEKQIKAKINLRPVKDKGMRKIISLATAKNQAERYQTASQMRVALENLDGLKRKMGKAARLKIAAACLTAVLIIGGIIGFSQYNAAVKERKAAEALAATNDSLHAESQRLITLGDSKFAVGCQHGEGYETSLMEAYNDYYKAVTILKRLSDFPTDVKTANDKINVTADALEKAKAEMDEKAAEFDSDGMPDFADEFRARSAKIQATLKK